MANIVADADSSCQGVVHRVTEQEFEVLKEIESNYETTQLPVIPYQPYSSSRKQDAADGSCTDNAPAAPADSDAAAPFVPGRPVTAIAFIVQPAGIAAMMQQHPEWGSSLPSDRYIRIITAGLRHYGADPAWVAAVAAEPCKHARQPHEYLKVPVPAQQQQQQQAAEGEQQGEPGSTAQLPQFSMQQLLQSEGQIQDNRVVFALGPKVIELDVSSKPDGPLLNIIQKHYAGKQAAFHMCMMLHEPRLPPLSTPADVRREHVEWAEDMMVEFMLGNGYSVRQVGWLQDEGGVGTAAAAFVVKDAAEALHEEDAATAAPDSGVWK
jgi:cation transport regulator ChaC